MALAETDPTARPQIAADTARHAAEATADMVSGRAVLARVVHRTSDTMIAFDAAASALRSYADDAQAIVATAGQDQAAARARLAQFLVTFRALERQLGDLSVSIEGRAASAQARAHREGDADATQIAVLAVAALALLALLAWTTRRSVVSMLAAKDRAEADAITVSHGARVATDRQEFKNRVNDALDMVDTESDVYSVVRRSMAAVSPDDRSEMLLADNSRAHLRVAADHPAAEGPGCPVESPWDCVAVRRGQTTVFESSEQINVCPKLRGRPGGACSAVCVPVTFMGRALGVLHAIGPDRQPPGAETVARLTVLATEAGTRIGTVRAFAKTQLQASTDALTGLPNRRELEERVRALTRTGIPFAVVVADLDHFKKINDTHGHEAGDRALRLFADLLRSSLRPDDIAARYGGEEFVLVLPNCHSDEAVAVLERLREALALVMLDGRHPTFTSSFGVATADAGESFDAMIARADEALYAAKEAGRNRVIVAGPTLRTPTS